MSGEKEISNISSLKKGDNVWSLELNSKPVPWKLVAMYLPKLDDEVELFVINKSSYNLCIIPVPKGIRYAG